MNAWTCEHTECKRSAVGCGGAVGLRAIGWYFEIGGPLLCPEHRPDKVPCDDKYSEGNHGRSCAMCAAEHQAAAAQDQLTTDADRIRLGALAGQPMAIALRVQP